MIKKYILIFIGIIALGIASFFGFKVISDSSYPTPDLANGKQAYIKNCMACHGETGLGDGIASASMEVKPDNIYQELINPFGFKAELINSVLSGDNGQGGIMPAFDGMLTEKEVNDIFGYIVSINEQ